MNIHSVRSLAVCCSVAVVAVVLPGLSRHCRGADERRMPAGRLQSAAGTLLQTGVSDPAWRAPASKSDVFTTDTLLALAGSRADILSKNGAVQLSLWGNVPEYYDFPLLESTVVLHDKQDRELAFTLVRGAVLLTKLKGNMPSRVQVTFRDNTYDLQLKSPESMIALELYGRWPNGAPFIRKPNPKDGPNVPTEVLLIYAIKGSTDLKIGDEQFLMTAPASFRWDNFSGRESRPTGAADVPSWPTQVNNSAEAEAMRTAAQKLDKQLAKNDPRKVLAQALNSDDIATRKLAVYGAAAMDDLGALVAALADPRRPDVRDTAIRALRHWIGQSGSHDMRLFNYLTRIAMYSEKEAEIVMHMLHSFRGEERDHPETYELLIEYLRHNKISIRELARSHLYRWVLKGRDIAYNAGDSPALIDKSYKEWKKLIPDGKLPPKPENKN